MTCSVYQPTWNAIQHALLTVLFLSCATPVAWGSEGECRSDRDCGEDEVCVFLASEGRSEGDGGVNREIAQLGRCEAVSTSEPDTHKGGSGASSDCGVARRRQRGMWLTALVVAWCGLLTIRRRQ